MADKDILADGKDDFRLCEEAEGDARVEALDDLRFSRLGEQWPYAVKQQRIKDGRPCLVINRMPAFIRQVVNESRQNRPSIKVHPVDSRADPQIAEIYDGLIRNIEQTSKADVAYDTAVDYAVTCGWGYFRIDTEYSYEDSFDLDLRINRIANPFAVYRDYASTASDSSDWNRCFVTDLISKDKFQRDYKGAQEVNWSDTSYAKLTLPWVQQEMILVAEWWTRERVRKSILALSDGSVLAADVYAKQKDYLIAQGVTVMGEREAWSHKVKQRIMTGAEVLEENDWAGCYIPIVPVYGDEINVEGKRYFRSLIRDAKDPQRMLNYWRTASTELTALAPRVPFIGKKGAFKSDARKWATINTQNHSHVEYDGEVPPARQPLDSGRAIGAIQEALNAQDDMKSIMGIYDPSLGAEGQEVSGKAILARQRQGQVSSFHFNDNLSRAIEHGGRILIDMIPKTYTAGRMLRVLDETGSATSVRVGDPITVRGPDGQQQMDPATELPMTKICDLSAGKYDLTVETGPSYGTKREETADHVLQMMQAYPPATPLLGDILAKNLDWPEADEIARRLRTLLPPQLQGDGAPQDPMQHPAVQQLVQQGTQHIQELSQQVAALSQQNQALQQDRTLEAQKVQIDQYKAETERMKVVADAAKPSSLPAAA